MSTKTVALWDNRSAPGGAGNTTRGLTRSLDETKEGLPMEGTRKPKSRIPIEIRLWLKVEKMPSGCWEYRGKLSTNGYGRIARGGRGEGEVPAHRVAWEQRNGPVPDGMILCHSCDNPPCVNPNHLFLGSHADNAADRNRKGRHRFGVSHHNARLTPDQVRTIRRWASEGLSRAESARRMDVSPSTVAAIVHGRLWRHVADSPVEDETIRIEGASA